MNTSKKFLTRQEVREKTGWSLVYIDKYVPRTKVGGKVLIPIDALDGILAGGNPLFRGEGTSRALGDIFQWEQGSPYSLGSADWKRFGHELMDAFRDHLQVIGKYGAITTLVGALAWSKTVEGQNFFDEHIPAKARQRRFAVYKQ